jgi:hypothetical protein
MGANCSMKIIGIAMVRNEDDILESFIRYNLQFLDHICIISHTSTYQSNMTLKNSVVRRLRRFPQIK